MHKKLKLTFTYPAAIGRNFDELLRVIDALQLSAEHNISTPADWKPGDDVIVPITITTEEATKKFEAEVTEVKSYLRFIPQPGNTICNS